MVTVLPSPSDWDRIAAVTGDPSWRAAQMTKYEDRVREWLGVEIPSPSLALGDRKVSSFLEAAAATFAEDVHEEASDLATLLQADVNARLRTGEATGLYRLPLATKSGKRSGARDAILGAVAGKFPLTVTTGAFVTRILWDDREPKAIGVEYVRQGAVYAASLAPTAPTDARQQAFAAEEIVLSAGAFNSPELLQLSGVGDPDALGALGIASTVARTSVGKNLQDRYEAAVVTTFDTPLDVVAACKLGETGVDDPCLDAWKTGGGVYGTSGFLATVLMRSSPSVPLADLQVFAVPTDARGYYPGYAEDSARAKNALTWLLLKAHTKNADGAVTLADASPFARPRISFNSYDEAAGSADPDLLALVEGVKFVRRIEDRMRTLVPEDPGREVWPGDARVTDAELAAWISQESWGHHACCTDAMGRTDDPAAVVDSRFRVIGAKHLRVVDASVFPEIPGTFIAMPTYMIAEKAADAILEDDK
jgi:choline dehydrogenase